MFTVVECVTRQHDLRLILVSVAIWLLGSSTFFLLLRRARDSAAHRRIHWTRLAAIAGGAGIWAKHFVAMLAYDGVMPMRFGAVLTLASIAVVMLLLLGALRLLGDGRDLRRCAGAGLATGVAIGAMHFTGMAAIVAAARIVYTPGPIIAAAAVASALFACAYVANARLSGAPAIVVPAMLALLSLCLLHYGAMAATTLVPDPTVSAPAGGLDRPLLITAVVLVTAGLLLLSVVAVLFDRYLTDLRGLAEAMLDGMAIVRDGQVVEANACFGRLLALPPAALVGRAIDDLMTAADGQPLAAERGAPVDVAVATAPDRALEVSTRAVEYRGRPSVVVAVRDLTEKRAAQRRIEHLARHDALTGLPNRAVMEERLERDLARARRDGQDVALVALDLDRFKAVNDIFGHAAGDDILRRIGRILSDAVRSTDTVARLGGDEFMILQVGAAQPDGAQALVRRILDDVAAEMDSARDPAAVGVSLGVAIFPADAADAAGLRHGADVALYRAKAAGRGVARFFDADMDRAVRTRRALEHDLRHAILRDQLRLAYQPLVSTAGGRVTGYEALLRWQHPDRGEILPDDFVPIAEESGSIVALGDWVLRNACAAAATWPSEVALAVNVSAVQFQLPNLADQVAAVLADTGLAPARLELEITETVLMRDRATARPRSPRSTA